MRVPLRPLPSLAAAITALLLALPAHAQAHPPMDHGHHHPAPDVPSADLQMLPAAPVPAPAAMAGHAGMHAEPLMARARAMGSGTSWNPALSPMRMWSGHAGPWLWMLHGDAVLGYNRQGGLRGGQYSPTWAAENWAMLMGSRYWGPGILDLRLMGSLEAFTLPPGGTPQLFQTGETYLGQPLLDRQHPHDLLMELGGRYTWTLTEQTALFLYGALVGEPALGPSAFMHRPSAADNHWAPLAHHLQDSTHITNGVLTAGTIWRNWQLEGSIFQGREPDENRLNLEIGPLDSWSSRLSWFPDPNWALQVSYGQLKNPEVSVPGDLHRTTASVMNVQNYAGGTWSNALIWGQNKEFHEGEQVLQSYGLESQLDHDGVNHLYGRFELVDKTGLALTGGHDHSVHRVGALTLGGIRDLDTSDMFDLGLGADATVYSLDSETRAAYGDNPFSFRVYLRLRPPTMQH